MTDVVSNYNAGAWTALTKMAERGAKLSTIVDVAANMDLYFGHCDLDDAEILRDVYGDISILEAEA